MATDTPFTHEEIVELRKLLEIEKIRKVKQLYSQHMDARDWDALAMIFSEGITAELGPHGTFNGRAALKAKLSARSEGSGESLRLLMGSRKPYDGLHCTTNMWIELTGPSTAITRTYLHDLMFEAHPRINPVIMFGIYDEDYEKLDGEWKIKRLRVQFLWPERIVADGFPRPMIATEGGRTPRPSAAPVHAITGI